MGLTTYGFILFRSSAQPSNSASASSSAGPFLKENQIKHRLFGVNVGGQFGEELVVTARRGGVPPLFDPKYR